MTTPCAAIGSAPALCDAGGSWRHHDCFGRGYDALRLRSWGCDFADQLPPRPATSEQCTLAGALSLAKAGGTVALATPAKTGHYVGNWSVATSSTSSSAPLTIKPAPGVSGPVLDGNHGKPAGCRTKACDGPVLTIGLKVHVDISGLTIQNGDNTYALGGGGAVQNDAGGTLIVSACTFSKNTADDGGAIGNADGGGAKGSLSVSASMFSANTAQYLGGAIDNGDHGGQGTAVVSSSTFSGNNAVQYSGGAIDSANFSGSGTLRVVASTFSGNSSGADGGAIDNGDGSTGTLTVSGSTFSGNSSPAGGAIGNGNGYGGAGTLTVSGSTFSGNTGTDGGAIDNGDSGTGTFSVSGSTFSGNTAHSSGGAIDDGDGGGTGVLTVSASTFSGNSATGKNSYQGPYGNPTANDGDGGAIAIGDNDGSGTVSVRASTFSANTARKGGGCHRRRRERRDRHCLGRGGHFQRPLCS